MLGIVPNPRILFTKRPGDGLPVIGEHITLDNFRSIDLDNVPLNGGYLSKTLLLSPEPAIRERMRDPKIPSYSTTLLLGGPVVGFGLVVVLRSEKEGIKPGDHLFGMTPFEAYTVQPYVEGRVPFDPSEWAPGTFDMDSLALQVMQDPQGAFPWTRYCSILGIPGLTAFSGFEAYANAKSGETIYISSGAGGVGSMVIQLAKKNGMKVIASAGSDDKVEYMKRLGADIAFNYKSIPVAEVLRENPLDLYWDNVGGSQLEAAIDALKVHGRIVACGSSGDYNLAYQDRPPVRNTTLIFKKRLHINGFLISDLAPTMTPRFFTEIPALLATGKMICEEHLIHGIENGPAAFIDMLKGTLPHGNPIIVVAQE